MPRSKKPSGRSKVGRKETRSRTATNVTYIVGEGENTEKDYLESFHERGVQTVKYKFYRRSNRELVEKAIGDRKGKNYAEVWVVFDLDYDPARGDEQYEEFAADITLAHKNGIKTAYSIDAFEVWLRLHYENITTRIPRQQLYDDLSRRWNINYEEEGKNEASTKELRNRLDTDRNSDMAAAITRAKNLHDAHSALPFQDQPSITTVYQLIHNLTTPKSGTRY
jgi:hypothetical protein